MKTIVSTDSKPLLIQLSEVTFRYSKESDQNVLNIPSWKVSPGERVLIIGSSGSGKSTLLNLLSGITPITDGQISVAGQALESLTERQRDRFRATKIGYVAQSFNLLPYLSAIDNINLSLYFSKSSNTTETNLDIESLLLELNIESTQWHKPVSQLSIGQQQRIAIARAIVNKPKLLIADEPTSALDHANRDRFMGILMTIAETHNMALVFVSHDPSLGGYFDRVDSMADINMLEV